MTVGASDRPGSPEVARLQASAWAGIFVFGIVMAILGAILPSLFERIGFGAGAAGNLFLTMNFAMLVTSLCFGPLVDRFGFKALLAVSAFLVAGAFLLLSRATSYGLVLAAAVVLGIGGGGLNGGTNALTSDLHEGEKRASALNVLGIFFGFGALSIPFLIGTLRDVLGLDKILWLATGLALVPFVIYTVLRFPKAKQAQGFPLKEAAPIVRSPLLWLAALILFFQSGNEFTVGGWISTYLEKTFGFGPGPAALVLAGYWAAVMAGRLVSSRLVRKVGNETAHPRQRRVGPCRGGAHGLRPVGRRGRGRRGGHRPRLRRHLPHDPGHRRRPFRRVHRDGLQHRHLRRPRRRDAGPLAGRKDRRGLEPAPGARHSGLQLRHDRRADDAARAADKKSIPIRSKPCADQRAGRPFPLWP